MNLLWWRRKPQAEEVPDIQGCTDDHATRWWQQWYDWCHANKIHYTEEETKCPYAFRCRCEACNYAAIEAQRKRYEESRYSSFSDGGYGSDYTSGSSSSCGSWYHGSY